MSKITCQKCGSDRIAHVQGKCSDCCVAEYKGASRQGYVPDDFGIGGSDDIEITFCLECGQLQGTWPLPEPDTSEDEGWDQPEGEERDQEVEV